MNTQNKQNASTELSDNVFDVCAEGATYRMVLPNAEVDYIQRKLATEHTPYELPMLDDMRGRLAAGDFVVDAGANIGNHTMYLASAARCKVAAFEPNVSLAEALRASARLNGLQDRVEVFGSALGKDAGKGHFAKDIPENLGAQSIDSGDGPLEIRRLDSFSFPEKVKAIKIDVEGMELDVLEGAAGLVTKDRPILYVECANEATFRKVHAWMSANEYGYWDTFNATPTHLFLPNELTTVDQRLSRLQLKSGQEAYQLAQQIAKTREMLDNANRKYRASTEQVANLKVQLAQEQAARQQAEKKAGEAAGQLADASNGLESERAALQQELAPLTTLGESYRGAASDAAMKLVRVEAALETTRNSLRDANEKYRAATEQIGTLKQQALQEQAASSMAAKMNAQLVTAQERLMSERAALQEEVARLNDQLLKVSGQAHEVQTRLARIETELRTATASLTEANGKYRFATEQVAVLKQRVVQEEQAALAAEKLWGEAQAELHQLKDALAAASANNDAVSAQLASLGQRVDAETAARKTAESVNAETRAQLEQARASLEHANLKYRRLTAEEIPQLKAKVAAGQALARELSASKKALADANNLVQRLRQQKVQAEEQVVKTRASLSFQLGYILIHGFKSPRAFLGIPSALIAWRKDVLKRRKLKQARTDRLQAAAIPAAHQLAPAAAAKALNAAAAHVEAKPAAPAGAALAAPPAPAVQRGIETMVAPKTWPQDLRQLKVACIMDEFTFGSYRAECQLLQLTPADWHAELEGFKPELLFIESAWRGKDELWGNKVGHNSQEVQGIVAWCRQHGVPTVFWNKEDPVHFETFLNTAMLFDCVFTTDIDCIHRYKAALQHDNVFLLPFACQPKNNHPIETYERKDAFCFAGAYYVRYPERTRDLGNFVAELPSFRPLEIYDRNFGKNDPNYQFPPEYQPYIVGTLPFDQIDKAYKGYRYAINLNSIKQSQTMFARRVFELMASNTVTVSNFSRGIRLMFGDLVITTDSGSEMVRHLNEVAGDESRSARLRLAALRKVLQEHTYEQRLAYVFSKVSGQAPASRQPVIAVLATAGDQRELDLVLAHFARQRYAHCRLQVMLADGFAPAGQLAAERVQLVPAAQCASRALAGFADKADFVAGMLAQDYYGPNYLLDIALATTYADADVIGKGARYVLKNDAAVLDAQGSAYRPASQLLARCAAVRVARIGDATVGEWLAGLGTAVLDSATGLAIDEFNYCQDGCSAGAAPVAVIEAVDDLAGLDTGVAIGDLLRIAEEIAPASEGRESAEVLSGRQLAAMFGKAPSAAIQLELDCDTWQVHSALPDGKHEYLYATKELTPAELGWSSKAKFYFDIALGLNLQVVLVFLDAQKQKIAHAIKVANRNQEADIPLGTVSIRFGLRIYAGGASGIKGLVLGHRDVQPSEIIGKADRLVLTNHYPSYDDLYRNGFVHSRVMAYRERGIRCDVFRLRPAEPVSYHEFEDVDVTTGPQEALNQMLSSGRYKTVLVHFLDPAMWEVLQNHVDRVKVVVWVHGADIQPWHRRAFNYTTEEQRSVAKMKSDARQAFWRGLLREMPANLHLVFVSRHSADEAMEDLGFRLPQDRYSIIHNPIDTDAFAYQKKSADQRKKVLSIRPYATATYANDLSVKAIELLSAKPWFRDIEFRMIGDGVLFEQTLEPLRGYANVHIEQRFLKKHEIAELHRDYGVFLCPTRMDTHGVSRDEAMASGLVPVTNAVAAIPEFVDAECGKLAEGEDAEGLAASIARLYESAEEFSRLSVSAAQRVRRQSAKAKMIALELELI